MLGYARLAPSPRKSAWHGGIFAPFLGRLCLLLGLLMRAVEGLKSITASGEKKRTFVADYCVKRHLLREVNAVFVEICLACNTFGPVLGSFDGL